MTCARTRAAGIGSHCPVLGRAAVCKIAAIGRVAAAATIASAAAITEAMAAPAVAIAPAGPWAHAQEDAVVEVPRPVKAIGRAGVRRIVVVAVRTDGLNADINYNLRSDRWHKGQAGEQCCRTE